VAVLFGDLAVFDEPTPSRGTWFLMSDFPIHAAGEVLSEFIVRPSTGRLTLLGSSLQISWEVPSTGPAADSSDEAAFERERAAFHELLPDLRARYAGRFVAVHGGAVVDSDPSSASLVRRFFERFGEESVYLGYVGGRRVVRNISPKVRRRS